MNKDNAKDYLPLVQALAEGKVVQQVFEFCNGEFRWSDVSELDTSLPADAYRIKPEPREIWVNRHEDAGLGYNFYTSKEAAADGIRHGWEPVCFREVIE